MKIAGFSTGAHDVSYALVENGIPINHFELERHNRIKECHADILKEFLIRNESADVAGSFHMHWHGGIQSMYPESFNSLIKKMNFKFVGHHKLHAANAFYSSNFRESLIITIDGGGTEDNGEDVAYAEYYGLDNKIFLLNQISASKMNIGCAWGIISNLLLGKGVGNQSGTIMAMAAFGEINEELVEYATSVISNKTYPEAATLQKYNKNDIAASLQEATERILFNLVQNLVNKYPLVTNICFAGGVSLNSLFLGKLKLKLKNHSFYVPPVPYDAGLAIGFGQYIYHQELGNNRIQWSGFGCTPYLGGKYNISDDIKKLGIEVDDNYIINLLSDNKIVSVYGGRSESGRRALGNRSILANPFSLKMKDMINEKVKHRQSFRPFAPSLLREDVSENFIIDVDCPYMFLCLPVREDKIHSIPAVVHKDGTARLQTVESSDNPWYCKFLKQWKKLTGSSVILNTSFNDREPIVETPEHALNCFNKTNIDYLYFRDEGILISKL